MKTVYSLGFCALMGMSACRYVTKSPGALDSTSAGIESQNPTVHQRKLARLQELMDMTLVSHTVYTKDDLDSAFKSSFGNELRGLVEEARRINFTALENKQEVERINLSVDEVAQYYFAKIVDSLLEIDGQDVELFLRLASGSIRAVPKSSDYSSYVARKMQESLDANIRRTIEAEKRANFHVGSRKVSRGE